jgi:hypothetical protein
MMSTPLHDQESHTYRFEYNAQSFDKVVTFRYDLEYVPILNQVVEFSALRGKQGRWDETGDPDNTRRDAGHVQ